jgi:hypothetical protein
VGAPAISSPQGCASAIANKEKWNSHGYAALHLQELPPPSRNVRYRAHNALPLMLQAEETMALSK